MEAKDSSVALMISQVLRYSVLVCATLLAIGLVLRSDAVISAGVVLLIALPIVRVVFSTFLFWRMKDWTYVALTLLVFTILLTGFILGRVTGRVF